MERVSGTGDIGVVMLAVRVDSNGNFCGERARILTFSNFHLFYPFSFWISTPHTWWPTPKSMYAPHFYNLKMPNFAYAHPLNIERRRQEALARRASRVAYASPSAIASRRRAAQGRRAWHKREREFAAGWRQRDANRHRPTREDRHALELLAAREFMYHHQRASPKWGVVRRLRR